MKVLLVAETSVVVEKWDRDDSTFAINEYKGHPFTSDVTDADELAEIAGRLCYKSFNRPNPETATNDGYLQNIIAQQHFSVLEHASATFWISGVSRGLSHELVRHRHLSFSQVSTRYVDESQGEFVMHPAIRDAVAEGKILETNLGASNQHARDVYVGIVAALTSIGVDRKTARGAARGWLPHFISTELVVTGNHRAWREFMTKRLAPGADAEIRELAQEILVILKEIAPSTYQDFE